jgi:hypothetical protein
MEKGIKSKTKKAAVVCAWCLAGVAGMWAVGAIGLRVNGTGREPVGIYWAVSKAPSKGDFGFRPEPIAPRQIRRAPNGIICNKDGTIARSVNGHGH